MTDKEKIIQKQRLKNGKQKQNNLGLRMRFY